MWNYKTDLFPCQFACLELGSLPCGLVSSPFSYEGSYAICVYYVVIQVAEIKGPFARDLGLLSVGNRKYEGNKNLILFSCFPIYFWKFSYFGLPL